MSAPLVLPLIPPLQPVPIRELKLLDNGRHWPIEQAISGLSSLTPVRGELRAHHQGNVLEVEGQVETSISLRCDRCLQQFNHPLQAKARELLGLGEAPAATCDQLNPRGYFDPEQWVYEQLSLQLPLVNHCGPGCPGPSTWSSEDPGGDPRWAALGQLKP